MLTGLVTCTSGRLLVLCSLSTGAGGASCGERNPWPALTYLGETGRRGGVGGVRRTTMFMFSSSSWCLFFTRRSSGCSDSERSRGLEAGDMRGSRLCVERSKGMSEPGRGASEGHCTGWLSGSSGAGYEPRASGQTDACLGELRAPWIPTGRNAGGMALAGGCTASYWTGEGRGERDLGSPGGDG